MIKFYKKQTLKKDKKIFCISMQRTGTTSVGEFFKHFGYKVAGWPISNEQKWSYYWYNGDYEKIFRDPIFRKNEVFEDAPWWLPEFYKVLFHRFPSSNFILFTRNADKWFDSMLSHSGGKTLGNTLRHAKVYRREAQFYNQIGWRNMDEFNKPVIDNLMSLEGKRSHYTDLYKQRNFEIKEFFKQHDASRLIECSLEEADKWLKLGAFFKIDIPDNFSIHANKS